jgi:hypothetical protein
MNVSRTYDIEAIDAILRDPSVFGGIIDDSSPAKSEFSAVNIMKDARNIVLMVTEDGANIGCFICIQCSPSTYEGHINLTALCRGRTALEALELGAGWLFTNTDAFRIIGITPESNKPALFITRLAGYQPLRVRENAVTISGIKQSAVQSELTLYKWLSTQPVCESENIELDTWHLQNLLFAKTLVESGNDKKAAFLLSELSHQSYAKRICIKDYPIIKIEATSFHVKDIFRRNIWV